MVLKQASQRCERKPVIQSKAGWSLFGALLLVALSGCETMDGLSCGSDGQRAVQEWVYFGTETPSGSVTSEAWTRFLGEVVTPQFPAGLSVWQASGQWRAASGAMVKEPTYILSLIHPNDPVTNKAIQDILSSYKTRFQQEAVLRVTTPVCTSL